MPQRPTTAEGSSLEAQLRRVPLLTPDEERVLAEVILAGRRPGTPVRLAYVPVEQLREREVYPTVADGAAAAETFVRHALAMDRDVRSARACKQVMLALARALERDAAVDARAAARAVRRAASGATGAVVGALISLERQEILDRFRADGLVEARRLSEEADRQAARVTGLLPLSVTTRARMDRAIHNATHEFILANMRLAAKWARQKLHRTGMPFEDVKQEATIGMMRMVTKFDPLLGYKFSTPASWWIRQGIDRSIAHQGPAVALPQHLEQLKPRIMRCRERLTQEGACDPSAEAIARDLALPVGNVEIVLRHESGVLSLSAAPGSEDGAFPLVERIAADGPDPSERVERQERRAAVSAVLDDLEPRERAILRMKFGLDGQPPMSDEEIGRHTGITRQRVGQIQDHATRKLRHPVHAVRLKEHVG